MVAVTPLSLASQLLQDLWMLLDLGHYAHL
jgi:hypothetical protein